MSEPHPDRVEAAARAMCEYGGEYGEYSGDQWTDLSDHDRTFWRNHAQRAIAAADAVAPPPFDDQRFMGITRDEYNQLRAIERAARGFVRHLRSNRSYDPQSDRFVPSSHALVAAVDALEAHHGE